MLRKLGITVADFGDNCCWFLAASQAILAGIRGFQVQTSCEVGRISTWIWFCTINWMCRNLDSWTLRNKKSGTEYWWLSFKIFRPVPIRSFKEASVTVPSLARLLLFCASVTFPLLLIFLYPLWMIEVSTKCQITLGTAPYTPRIPTKYERKPGPSTL